MTQRHGNSDSIARQIARELRSGNKLKEEPMKIALVCSNKPRPSVQSNRGYKNIKTGECLWGRDVYHAANAADKSRTLCGVDSSEFLTINPNLSEEELQTAIDDFHLCRRCYNKLIDIENAKPDAYLQGIMDRSRS